MTEQDNQEALIRGVSFFRQLDRVDLARLVGMLEPVHFPAGQTIFAEGDEADSLYILGSGDISVTVQAPDGERSVATLHGPAHFGELGLLLARRTASARTLTDVDAWRLPRDRFQRLVREKPALGQHMAVALAGLLDQRSREYVGAPIQRRPPPVLARPTAPRLFWRYVGLLLAFGIPVALWWLKPPAALTTEGWHAFLVMLGGTVAWLFEPLPDFVVGLLIVAAWGAAGLAPLSVTFSGFANPSWLVALGALVVAASMAQSGLLFRIALWFLRIFPRTHRGQVLGLLVSGLALTPLVPLSVARIAAIAPVGRELGQAMGYPPKSRAAAAISFAGLTGYGYFSSVFLTGLASNFFVLGLFPPADRARFDWFTWLLAAAPSGLLMLVAAGAALMWLFPAEVPPRVTTDVLQRQWRALGPMSRTERGALLALSVLLAGLIVEPVVHVDPQWLAVAAITLAIGWGGLDRERFRSSVDWGLLILFGIFFGSGDVLSTYGLDQWIVGGLTFVTRGSTNSAVVVVAMTLFVVGVRLFLPRVPAQLLLSLAFVRAAPALGISPWVAGYIVLMVAYTWIIPGQGLEYLITRELTKGEAFTDRQGVRIGVALTVIRVLAIAASIPFWQAMGLFN